MVMVKQLYKLVIQAIKEGLELNEIRMRLDEKRKQQKFFSIFSLSSGGWWKIAAMFILFAGGVISFMPLIPERKLHSW